jgi:hypothetical protein
LETSRDLGVRNQGERESTRAKDDPRTHYSGNSKDVRNQKQSEYIISDYATKQNVCIVY